MSDADGDIPGFDRGVSVMNDASLCRVGCDVWSLPKCYAFYRLLNLCLRGVARHSHHSHLSRHDCRAETSDDVVALYGGRSHSPPLPVVFGIEPDPQAYFCGLPNVLAQCTLHDRYPVLVTSNVTVTATCPLCASFRPGQETSCNEVRLYLRLGLKPLCVTYDRTRR